MFSEADRRLAQRSAERHGVFTLAAARTAGLTPEQVHVRSMYVWERLYRGVFRLPGAPRTIRGDLLAACLAAPPPAAVSHRSAAALYGLPGGRIDLTEITCRRWRRTQKPGLVVHERVGFDSLDVHDVDGLPVVRAELLVVQLAGVRPVPNYVEAVIQAARRNRLLTYESTMATFVRVAHRGVPGVRAARAALERWDPTTSATQSEMETMLLQTLRRHGLPEAIPQYEVLDDDGVFVAYVDAALPRWRIVIEYDSKQEHSDEFQLAKDARRRNAITGAGYWMLSARCDDLRRGGAALVDEIRRIAQRSA